MTQAYPLQWPSGWPRATQRKSAPFGQKGSSGRVELTVAAARERLAGELDLLKAGLPILSTNIELRIDGQPRSGQPEPRDPGAAVYFQLDRQPTVLACDKWDRVADNIAALAKHIEALRGIDRWGVGTAKQAFAGYQALPAPEQWWQVLGISERASRAEIEAAFRAKAKVAHPDHGGSHAAMARLNAAREQGINS